MNLLKLLFRIIHFHKWIYTFSGSRPEYRECSKCGEKQQKNYTFIGSDWLTIKGKDES